jgi:hypothetical protein
LVPEFLTINTRFIRLGALCGRLVRDKSGIFRKKQMLEVV